MKFKSKEQDKKVMSLEEREKKVKKAETAALVMMCIAVTLVIIGGKFMLTMYEVSSSIATSPLYKGMKAKDKENDTLDETKKILDEIENIFEEVYVNEIEREYIDEYVCSALIDAYGDTYSVYRDPDETVDNFIELGSSIYGIGILSRAELDDYTDEYNMYIIDVYDDSPAEKAGLKPGDLITHVKGKRLDMYDYTFKDAIEDIKGKEGTSINLTYKRDNKEYTVDIERKHTKTRTVKHTKLNDTVGYIEIRQFEEDTYIEFKDVIEKLKADGIDKYIFDLRENTGGLKDSAVKILDYLLDEGLIMNTVDKNGNIIETETSDANHIEFESVTIIDDSTASAAELFTQCLLDYNKTITVGKKSFGKGTVCTTIGLSNGGTITVSTGKYLTKSGFDIEDNGIEPQYEVRLNKEKDEILYKLPIEDDDVITKALEIIQK